MNKYPLCGRCESKECRNGKDCFSQADNHKRLYQNSQIAELHKAASAIEGHYYGKETRLGEIILFAKELRCQKLGLAFCIGLSDEAKIVEEILSKHFKVISVCCKVCGIDKKKMGLKNIKPERFEATCNPIGQATILNNKSTDLNIIVGLCMGHDILFSKHSKAPVTTLVVKDRVLAHSPLGAIYSRYYRKKFGLK